MAVRRLATVLVFALALAAIGDARGQGVWKQLEGAAKDNAANNAESRAKAWADHVKKSCDEAAQKPNAAKCRSYYLSNSYLIHWLNEESPVVPSLTTEVLVRGDEAVVCYRDKHILLDDAVPCTPMRKVN